MKHYIFLHALNDDNYVKQRIVCYDFQIKRIIQSEVKFVNWFYIEISDLQKLLLVQDLLKGMVSKLIIPNFHFIGKAYLSGNANIETPNHEHDLQNVIKVFYGTKNSINFIKHEIFKVDPKYKIFETEIPKNIRFTTFLNLSFLDSIVIDGDSEVHPYKIQRDFEIPFVLLFGDRKIYYNIDEDRNFFSTKVLGECIVFYWNQFEEKSNNKSFPMGINIYSLLINFLRIYDERHSEKCKITPFEYSILISNNNPDKKFEILDDIIKKYFPLFVKVTQYIPIPIYTLLESRNRKIIPDITFLANKKNFIICSDPKDQPSYCSNAYIELFTTNMFVTGKIYSLDYVSFYPSMMNSLFDRDPRLFPYGSVISKFLEIKSKENNPLITNAIKIMLNSFYGSFGISSAKSQMFMSSNVNIASSICSNCVNLLKKTIEYFKNNNNIEILYCNTDGLIVTGNNIEKTVEEWNKGYNNKFRLKIDMQGNKLLFINKQERIWLDNNFKIKTTGYKFNSLLLPEAVRNYLKIIVEKSMNASNNLEGFKYNFLEFSKVVLEDSKKFEPNSLKEVVFIKSSNNSKYNVLLKLFSSMDGGLLDINCLNSNNLIGDDIKNRNYGISKILLRCIEELGNRFAKL